MHVSFPDKLHFTFDCLQFSQAVRSFGVSPLLEGVPDSVSIEGHEWVFRSFCYARADLKSARKKGKAQLFDHKPSTI